jgi:hypothetical protein
VGPVALEAPVPGKKAIQKLEDVILAYFKKWENEIT